MADPRTVAVIDIGKTNVKVAIFDLVTQTECDRLSTANTVLQTVPYPHFDIEALWLFIVDSMRELRTRHSIDAISITAHGASAALLDASGELALPVLDYEYEGPQSLASEYGGLRPSFTETGSPRLPAGLNLGAQIYWQSKTFPAAFANVKWIVTYPQYWAFRLSGVFATEVTSLGCHTDLWDFKKRDYSGLVYRMNWQHLMPPTRQASDLLGPLLPDIAKTTGLKPSTPIFCGIHDSNASLYPHLRAVKAPFCVVSTGTWVVCMAVGGREIVLDAERDTLVNVNAFGDAVPSARFMGGREYQTLFEPLQDAPNLADIKIVLQQSSMVLPSVSAGSGPFPNQPMKWLNDKGLKRQQRQIAASFYLALMTATCLSLIGAQGPTVIEGPFAENLNYLQMLSAATGRPVFTDTAKGTGTTKGAALLCLPDSESASSLRSIPPAELNFDKYAEEWNAMTTGY